jgi:hypothetical protein
VDVEGYWQPLLALIDNVIDQGFAEASLRNLFMVAQGVGDVAGLIKKT